MYKYIYKTLTSFSLMCDVFIPRFWKFLFFSWVYKLILLELNCKFILIFRSTFPVIFLEKKLGRPILHHIKLLMNSLYCSGFSLALISYYKFVLFSNIKQFMFSHFFCVFVFIAFIYKTIGMTIFPKYLYLDVILAFLLRYIFIILRHL